MMNLAREIRTRVIGMEIKVRASDIHKIKWNRVSLVGLKIRARDTRRTLRTRVKALRIKVNAKNIHQIKKAQRQIDRVAIGDVKRVLIRQLINSVRSTVFQIIYPRRARHLELHIAITLQSLQNRLPTRVDHALRMKLIKQRARK